MAQRKYFFTKEDYYYLEKLAEFEFNPGFAVSQKQKNMDNTHAEIKKAYPDARILEVSTKSREEIGQQLSAFNLMFHHEELDKDYHLENIFQSSKVFEHGGPYRDLLEVDPGKSKKDERLKTSGKLIGFELYGKMWPTVPETMFYDWCYIKALSESKVIVGDPENNGAEGGRTLAEAIMDYDFFTDVEFNHNKSINCQARSAVIFVSLVRKDELDRLDDIERFAEIYR